MATLRLQLHRDFNFASVCGLIDYYADLGISHLYLSPITTAMPASPDGYDVVDTSRVNPELGGETGLRRLVRCLRQREMGLVIDIVPNYMYVGGAENQWWYEVLEFGRTSDRAAFFDIDWDSPLTGQGKVLAPFLNASYGETLANGELRLVYERPAGRLQIAYSGHRYPLNAASLIRLFDAIGTEVGRSLAQAFAAAMANVDCAAVRAQACEIAYGRCRDHFEGEGGRTTLEGLLAQHDPSSATGRGRLHQLLEEQHYRLASWRLANDEINWRRCFGAFHLAALSVERDDVFECSHALYFRLYAEGLIDGLRIEFIDGLTDPAGYCRKLRRRLSELTILRPAGAPNGRPWLVAEKILTDGERLREDWQLDGTTGYDFMNEVAGVLHDPKGVPALRNGWHQWLGGLAQKDFAGQAWLARRKVLTENFAADLDAATRALHALACLDHRSRDISFHALRRVLIELVVYFPQYRIYADRRGHSPLDAAVFAQALAAARSTLRQVDHAALDQVAGWMVGAGPALAAGRMLALRRFQLLTSPVSAAAFEDRASYHLGLLLSRNEVGSDPGRFAYSVADFHAGNAKRRQHTPLGMLTLATHDHKCGADVRARLAVLSEMAEEWVAQIDRWLGAHAPFRSCLAEGEAPTIADEVMFYQTLLGAWPADLEREGDPALIEFAGRIGAWQQKAEHEGKLQGMGYVPDRAYDEAVTKFRHAVLASGSRFLGEIIAMVRRIAPAAAVNGLTQTVLHYTAPGVPDLYQGTEFWDWSLVGPDSRRPIDYPPRIAALARVQGKQDAAYWTELRRNWRDGRLKQAVIHRLLQLRRNRPALLLQGNYQPLLLRGIHAERVLAFLRQAGDECLLVILPRLPLPLMPQATEPAIAPSAWADTAVQIPAGILPLNCTDVVSGLALRLEKEWLNVADLLERLPLAVLYGCDYRMSSEQHCAA
ncbi:malto-oligosyltrehalose synthase [Chitinimonas arctica]|uniref:malto-oligosyltrehalose synthase n=1 Tax=Chitinimonas arctica TaxID=2594795 RepID=UPI0021DFCE6C|nr:malto-oligosyltrehalose synthase [Chitinimonas arctica]